MPFNSGRLTVGGGLLISALLLLSGCGDGVDALRKAAEQGNAQAQSNLGAMYQDGKVVPQSDTEAVKWYRKAAEQGFTLVQSDVQSNLGMMYADGRGVPQSD